MLHRNATQLNSSPNTCHWSNWTAWTSQMCTSSHLFKLKNRCWRWNPGPQTVSVLLYTELHQSLLIGSELPVPKKHPKKECQEYRKLLHLPTYPPLQEEKKKRKIGKITCLADSAVDVICDRLSNQTVIFISLFHIHCCTVWGQDVRIATSTKQCWPRFAELPLLPYRSQDTPGETLSFSYMHVCCVQHSCAGNA